MEPKIVISKQKYIGYIFLYNLYIFVWVQHSCFADTGFALDSSVMKRLCCLSIVDAFSLITLLSLKD